MSKLEENCDCNNDCPCKGEPVTMEEKQLQHDDWWNSLTNEEKQKLYEEAERAEEERIERMEEELAWRDNPLYGFNETE